MKDYKTHIIKHAVEEKGFDEDYKYNELKVNEYKDNSILIKKSDNSYEDTIYLYPSQLKHLKKVIDKIIKKEVI